MTAKCDLQSIKIAKDAVDPDDIETLEDLVTLAVRDAITKANTTREEKLKSILPANLPGGFGF
jgi:DNA-binding protein YbaB